MTQVNNENKIPWNKPIIIMSMAPVAQKKLFGVTLENI